MRTERERLRAGVLAALAVLALCPGAGAAQERHIRFDRLSVQDGLSSATVPCLIQDSTGFIWLGTQDGLNRYDGHSFEVFKHEPGNPATLADNWVRALTEDASGDLWIATAAGLSRWRRATDTFVSYRHDPGDPASLSGDRVWSLLADRAGDLWVGTENAGLNRLARGAGAFERFRHDPGDPASLSDDRIRALHEDRSGRLWVGTLGGGLNLYDRETGTFERFRHDPDDPASLADDNVRSILEDHTGSLWVGTLGGLHRSVGDRSRPAFERFRHDPADPHSLSENRVRVLFEDRSGRLWIGTDGGLDLLDRATGRLSHYRHRAEDPASLSIDRVVSIYQDRGGVLWVGTEGGGVNTWHSRTWSFSNDKVLPSDLSSRYILSVALDSEGHLWLGTNGHGLDRLHRSTGAVRPFRHAPESPGSLSDDRIPALLVDRQDVLWVGTLAGGLNRYDPATETFERFAHDPGRGDSLGADGVMSLYEDREGTLWVGTYGGGLNRFDAETQTFVRHRHDPGDPRSLSDDKVSALAERAGGPLWVGTYGGGLNRFDRERGVFRRLRHDPHRRSSLSSDTVLALHLAPTGVLWVGTHNGLNRLEALDDGSGEAVFRSYFESDGLPSAVIYAVYSDARSRLWLATNKGISRFDPVTGAFKSFDVSHGLASDELNMGAHTQSPAGELIFGGIGGFNAFHPDRIEVNATVPPVALTSFSKLNRPVRLDRPVFDLSEIELDHRDHVVSFEFAALDYTAPARNRYRYRLDGFDSEWNDLGHRRRLTFTNLDPGGYVLRVQGSNNDGVWNEEGASIAIAVAPPPWRTWWAHALYALALAAATGTFVRSQQRRVERERAVARRERAQAEERARLIAELEEKNAELERFNYTVSHDLKSPLLTIKGFLGLLRRDLRAGDYQRLDHDLDRIDVAADRMHVLLHELLELSRIGHQVHPPEEVAMDQLAREAVDQVAGLIDRAGVEVHVAPGMPAVRGERIRLQEVYQNLIENAVKYMGEQAAPCIEVGAEQRNGSGPVFFVRDNGVGIDPRYREKIFGLFERLDTRDNGTGVGLALVRRIVELHGGRVWVESPGVGRGSTFCFTLPRAGAADTAAEAAPAAGEKG